ncbi:MAG: acylneuraminate cytidylyltransferase family protein [Firmicutes bacterium]|nr:acylneuraminate cytidylyltransferase family protein [Bacillota bacterium]
MRIVAFVPVKLTNERLPNKNTKPFDNGEPLIKYILKSLKQVEGIDNIFVYCSNPTIKEFLSNGVEYLQRKESLDTSETPINDVMKAFASDVPADVYILAHATAPFVKPQSIRMGINKVVNEGYDSALTVTRLQEFLWADGKPFNYSPTSIPRTQDIKPMYVETTGLYIYTNELITNNLRIGVKPYLIEVSKIEAMDINVPEDFEIANAIFNTIFK